MVLEEWRVDRSVSLPNETVKEQHERGVGRSGRDRSSVLIGSTSPSSSTHSSVRPSVRLFPLSLEPRVSVAPEPIGLAPSKSGGAS